MGYKEWQGTYLIDFIVESDEGGFSCVSRKNGKFYWENWMRGPEGHRQIDLREINKIERNRILHTVRSDEGY